MSNDLVFKLAPATTGDLLAQGPIGVQYAGTVTGTFAPLTASLLVLPPVDANIAASFPALTATVSARFVTRANVTGSFAPLQAMAEARYVSNAHRPTVGQTIAPWQVTHRTEQGATMPQQVAAHQPAGFGNPWQPAAQQSANVTHELPQVLVRAPESRTPIFQQATPTRTEADAQHQNADRIKRDTTGRFQDAQGVRTNTFFKHEDGDRTKRASRRTGMQDAARQDIQRDTSFQKAMRKIVGEGGLFQAARPPLVGVSVLPSTPTAVYYTPSGDLVFSKAPKYAGPVPLLFTPEGYVPPVVVEPVSVPVKRVYIVLNNVNLRRVSDDAIVPCMGMSLSLDAGSWTWGFDASLPGSAQALVEPDANGPIELKASVNGTEFRVLAENISRERSFGQISIKVGGRGRNAALDAPYAAEQTFGNTQARTHQQLFDDVLSINGVSLGYAIDYGLEDWAVPAGVFNHQGTYISAIAALAQAGGGYLIPHPSNLSFKVRHRYPVKPWETATPDFILPADVLVRESIAWKEKPAYNRVYVSGQSQGVLGQVTRQGTAGDILAPMVTDALITTAAAARQRGLAVLGDTGKQLELSLSLPVLSETGIIQPGMYVQYADGTVTRTGIVRSTQVAVGEVEVKQTLGVEVHA